MNRHHLAAVAAPVSARRRRRRSSSSRAFTLVEILIVVIILGILAAIVIPTFANASGDARKTSMRNQLQSMRGTVELYRVEHRDVPPLLITDGWEVVTAKTDIEGTVAASGTLGPYLPGPVVNPLTNSSAIVPVGSAAATTNGWFYDEATGVFRGANTSGAMSDTGE